MKSIYLQILSCLASLLLIGYSFGQESQTEERHQATPIASSPVQQNKADLNLITPPQGFTTTDLFNGYIHKASSTTMVMTMLEGVNYLKICEGMNESYFQEQKLTLVSETKFQSTKGVKGRYYKFTFDLNGKQFIRYVVYAGDLNNTLWLHITFPAAQAELVEPLILESIQTIRIKPESHEAK